MTTRTRSTDTGAALALFFIPKSPLSVSFTAFVRAQTCLFSFAVRVCVCARLCTFERVQAARCMRSMHTVEGSTWRMRNPTPRGGAAPDGTCSHVTGQTQHAPPQAPPSPSAAWERKSTTQQVHHHDDYDHDHHTNISKRPIPQVLCSAMAPAMPFSAMRRFSSSYSPRSALP